MKLNDITKFEHSLFNAYDRNNHLPMGLKFIKNANNHTLKIMIKAYGILINPVWLHLATITYSKGVNGYAAQLAYRNPSLINGDEGVSFMEYTAAKSDNDPVTEDSSDELTTSYSMPN